jgi:RNA polymerase primary sigma factor
MSQPRRASSHHFRIRASVPLADFGASLAHLNRAKENAMKRDSSRRSAPVFVDEDPLLAYFHDIKDSHKLTWKEEKELAARIRTGDRRAVNELVSANLKFVVAVCRQFENRGLPLIDLINEGNLGLIRAAERFDEKQECRFISYAVWWIRQAVTTALADQTRAVRLSTSTTTRMRQVTVATRKLSQRLGRDPSVEELELETGMQAGTIRDYLRLLDHSVSLDSLPEGLEGDAAESTEACAERFHAKRAMDQLLKGLSAREREVLDLYFGLKHGETCNLPQMAKLLGLSKERVRQIKEKAIAKLKVLLVLNAKYPCATLTL